MSTNKWRLSLNKLFSSFVLGLLLLSIFSPATYAQDAGTVEIVEPETEPTTENEPGVAEISVEAPTGAIQGIVWDDLNGDALMQAGTEPGIEGVNVALYLYNVDFSNSSIVATTATDADGNYSFDGLVSGNVYYVSVQIAPLMDQYSFSRPFNKGDDDIIDSDVEAFIGYSMGSSDVFRFDAEASVVEKYEKVRVSPGGLVLTDGEPTISGTTDTNALNAGLVAHSVVSGRVWLDNNFDGVESDDTAVDPGADDVLVRLYRVRGEGEIDADGNSISGQLVNARNEFTDADGNYSFDNLPVGEYFVQISRYIPDSLLGERSSAYNFPCGGFTSLNAGDETIDNDFNQVTGETDLFVITTPGSETTDIDAGFVCGDVHGVVWNDLNNDGVRQNDSEPRVPGMNVALYHYNEDTSRSFQVATTVTDDAGQYLFNDLVEGDFYYVSFSLVGFVDNYRFTRPMNAGSNDFIDSEAEAYIGFSQGSSDVFEFTESSLTATTYQKVRVSPGGLVMVDDAPVVEGTTHLHNIDAGLVGFSTIEGRVWADRDSNGLQSTDLSDENGIENVLVRIYRVREDDEIDADGNSIAGQLVNARNVYTDENGDYFVNQIGPGNYVVSVPSIISPSLLQPGETDTNNIPDKCSALTMANVGDADTLDSDIDPTSMLSESYMVNANDSLMNVDAGFVCEPNSTGTTGGGTTDPGDDTNDDGKETSGGGSRGSGSGIRLGGNNTSTPTPSNPTFTGQQATDFIGTRCLELNDRALTFSDNHGIAADILKDTAIDTLGYMGETQYVISGYNNSTFETGTAVVGEANQAYILEVAKILITSGLCMPILDARTLDVEEFADLPKDNPGNQWVSDLFYTAKSVGLIKGHSDMYADNQRPVHAAEFVAMLVRTYELQHGTIDLDGAPWLEDVLSPAAWYFPYYRKAAKVGILSPDLMQPHEILTRRTVFSLVLEFLLEIDAYKPEELVEVMARLS